MCPNRKARPARGREIVSWINFLKSPENMVKSTIEMARGKLTGKNLVAKLNPKNKEIKKG